MPRGRRSADYDQTLKRLLFRAHDSVLGLFVPGAHWVRERSPELPSARRQADIVWEVARASGERLLLHIELQTKPDKDIGERVAEYALRLWRNDHLPVHSVVVYLRRARQIPSAPFVFARGDGNEAMRFHYEIVRLWEEPLERVLAMPEAGIWPLAALMAGMTTETLVTVAERIAEAPLPQSERGELTGLLAVLAGVQLTQPVVERILRRHPMVLDLLRYSSATPFLMELAREQVRAEVKDEVRAEVKDEVRAEVKDEVRAEVKDEVRRDVEREMARTILESRFGMLDAAETTALATLDEAGLRAITDHLATDSRGHIRVLLGLT